ncbi:MAG TPA: SCO2524 family protein [Pseudonocardiaceae bacterium]|nr:SCO2524 family protein [Pseudonocardiaceae bacterium]
MRIEPRRQTLEVWQAVADYSRRGRDNGEPWRWGGRDGRNSISDAEQILCLMYPAAEVANFRLDTPDEIAEDVLAALSSMGDSREIPRLIVDVLTDYMTSYTADAKTPVFSGEGYFRAGSEGTELTAAQRRLDVVDSFATSISLTLATLGFLKVFRPSVRRPELRRRITELETMTSTRLSAAMVGLLRSFSVNVFKAEDPPGKILLNTLKRGSDRDDRNVLAELNDRLRPVRASLRDAKFGISTEELLDELEDEDMMFELGFSWGVVRGAPLVPTEEPIGEQPEGVALNAPFLYFTVVAIDGIVDLFSERSRVLGLLNTEQQRLAQALQLRWDLTMGYWSAIARFSSGRWPLENIPWQTTDDEESEYYSLLVTAVVIQELLTRRATDDDLTRTVGVLEELAMRGRVNRRMLRDADTALPLHTPGVRLALDGGEALGPPMRWQVNDFSALLLKRALRAAGLSRNINARDRLLVVAEDALEHMSRRRIHDGEAVGLWDSTEELFGSTVALNEYLPSWYMTERMVECHVMATRTVNQPPVISSVLISTAIELLGEADHLFSQYQLEVPDRPGSRMHDILLRINAKLIRAREVLRTKPATSVSIAHQVLNELDELAVAQRAARSR